VSPAFDGDELRATVRDADARVATLEELLREPGMERAAHHNLAWVTWRDVAESRRATRSSGLG
jgi:hypothetical protein